MSTLIPQQQLQQVIDDLVHQGWSVSTNFFPTALTESLHLEVLAYAEQDSLQAAKIGNNELKQQRIDIRGDKTRWLNGETAAQRSFMDIMDTLRQQINRELFLGLHEQEAHFALYTPGTGYDKHYDTFQNNNLRRVTTVSYLTPNWQAQDHGELIIFNQQDQELLRVVPESRTLVCFISDQFPHQVAITQRQRTSIAGWFRTRSHQVL